MSDREKIVMLLDSVPDYKLGYVLAYIQGITANAAAEDDAFCNRMYEEYLQESDTDNTMYSLDECKKEWGLE